MDRPTSTSYDERLAKLREKKRQTSQGKTADMPVDGGDERMEDGGGGKGTGKDEPVSDGDRDKDRGDVKRARTHEGSTGEG